MKKKLVPFIAILRWQPAIKKQKHRKVIFCRSGSAKRSCVNLREVSSAGTRLSNEDLAKTKGFTHIPMCLNLKDAANIDCFAIAGRGVLASSANH